jgi:hypothetical protein
MDSFFDRKVVNHNGKYIINLIYNKHMFIRKEGKTKVIDLPVTPSTALAAGSLVCFSSGKLIAMTSSTAASALVGVLVKAITATDDDYADDRLVAVEVPVEKNVVYEFTTASLVATDVGTLADLTDASTVNRGASTYDVVRITGYKSATVGYGVLQIVG